MNKKIIAIIPARKGSKRLPQKNTKLFANTPLLNYTLRFALLNDFLEKIIVTTDDELVKEITTQFNIELIPRPSHLADDLATTASAVQHSLKVLAERGEECDYVVTLQITNPLRPKNLLSDCLNILKLHPEASSIVSFSRNWTKLGTIENSYYNPTNYKPGQRSQDLTPLYAENGLIYVSDAKMVLETGDLFGKNILAHIIEDDFPIIDIDTIIDFEWGEYIFKKYYSLFEYLQ